MREIPDGLRDFFDWCDGLISDEEFKRGRDYLGHGELVKVIHHSYHDECIYGDGFCEFYYIGD